MGQRAANGTKAVQCSPVRTTRSDERSLSRMSAKSVGPVLLDGCDQPGGSRGDVRVGVDLPVRVVQGDADRLAAVLEREHLLHAGECGQCGGAIGPGLDDGASPRRGEAAERALVLRAEADHLAAPDRGAGAADSDRGEVIEVAWGASGSRDRRTERRRLVLEHRDVVVARAPRTGSTASAAPAGRARPAAGRRGSAERRRSRSIRRSAGPAASSRSPGGLQDRRRSGARSGCEVRVGVVEVDQLATVGERVHAFGDRGHGTPFEGVSITKVRVSKSQALRHPCFALTSACG